MSIRPADVGPMLPSANPGYTPPVGRDDWPCNGLLLLNSIA